MENIEKQNWGQFKQLLLEEKARIEEELKEIEEQIPGKDDGWRPKFPNYGTETSEQEENADEVEEFAADLTLGKQMEQELKDINDALQKIENGTYGICENCKKPIDEKRLEASPSARTHIQC